MPGLAGKAGFVRKGAMFAQPVEKKGFCGNSLSSSECASWDRSLPHDIFCGKSTRSEIPHSERLHLEQGWSVVIDCRQTNMSDSTVGDNAANPRLARLSSRL